MLQEFGKFVKSFFTLIFRGKIQTNFDVFEFKSDWSFFKFFLKMKKWIKSRSNISSSSRAKLRKVSVRQFLLVARTTTLDGLLTVAARSRENAMTLSSFILVLQGHNTTTEEDANSDTTYATWKWLEGHIKAYLWIWQLLRSLQTHLHKICTLESWLTDLK